MKLPLHKKAALLLALALASALLLGWAPGAAAAAAGGSFEAEEDDSDTTDVAIDLSVKAYEVSTLMVGVWSGTYIASRSGV